MATQTPKPASHLDELSEEQVEDFHTKITEGYTAKQIYEYMTEHHKVWLDKKAENIAVFISRVKKKLTKKMVKDTVGAKLKSMGHQALAKRLDTISQLEELVAIQTKRFHKMYAKEEPGPLLMKTVSDEAVKLQSMLVDLGKLQLETGILRRAPKHVTGTLVGADGTMQQFSWSEEQEALMKELQGAVIDHESSAPALSS